MNFPKRREGESHEEWQDRLRAAMGDGFTEPEKSRICRDVVLFLESPAANEMQEASEARMYVTFTQDFAQTTFDETGKQSKLDQITYGPYLGVEISDEEMRAETESGEVVGEQFVLATSDESYWVLNDGSDSGRRSRPVGCHGTCQKLVD
jgi:hypothetical protein